MVEMNEKNVEEYHYVRHMSTSKSIYNIVYANEIDFQRTNTVYAA